MALNIGTLIVEIGFDADPMQALADVDWTDVTEWVRSYKYTRGRQHELDKPQAGSLNLVLENSDRRFDPTNPSSPYVGKLLPLRRVRVSWDWAGSVNARFVGYIESWPVDWTGPRTSTVTVQAVDAFKILAGCKLPATPYELEVRTDEPIVWYRLDESQASLALDSSGNRIDGQYQGEPVQNLPPLIADDPGKSVSFLANTRVSIPYKDLLTGFPFTVEFWFMGQPRRSLRRQILMARDTATNPDSMISLSILDEFGFPDDAGALSVYLERNNAWSRAISDVRIDLNAPRHCVAVLNGTANFDIWVDGVKGETMVDTSAPGFPRNLDIGYTIGNYPATPIGDFALYDWLDDLSIYTVALTPDRIAAHYEAGAGTWEGDTTDARLNRLLDHIGWAAADRFFEVGAAVIRNRLAAGSCLAYFQKLEETEVGTFFVSRSGQFVLWNRYHRINTSSSMTWRSTPTTSTQLFYDSIEFGLDEQDIRNRVEITREGGVPQLAKDAASIALYGEREFSRDGVLHSLDQEALDHARWIMLQYANPVPRVRSMTISPAANPNAYPAILQADIGAHFTVIASPPGGGAAFNQQSHVERIAESYVVGPKETFTIEFGLSKVDTLDYWTLGTSTLDSTTRLAA